MAKIKLLALGIFSVVFASATQASLLGFEKSTEESTKNLNSVVSDYDGISWNPNFYLYNNAVFPTPVISEFYGAVNSDVKNPIAISSAVAFNFNGFWLSGWSANATSFVASSEVDRVDGLKDSATQAIIEAYESYIKVNIVEINRKGNSGDQYFAVNDVAFNKRRSNVPDPSSFFLLGVGILALAVARRNSAV